MFRFKLGLCIALWRTDGSEVQNGLFSVEYMVQQIEFQCGGETLQRANINPEPQLDLNFKPHKLTRCCDQFYYKKGHLGNQKSVTVTRWPYTVSL